MSEVVIYTDGGSRSNPGEAGAGAVIYDGDPSTNSGQAKKVGELSEYLGIQTNNWAEYEALIRALKKAKALGLKDKHIEVRMDSELIVKQLHDQYQVKEETLWPQFMTVHNMLVKDFKHISFVHVRREENTEADALANAAMDAGQ